MIGQSRIHSISVSVILIREVGNIALQGTFGQNVSSAMLKEPDSGQVSESAVKLPLEMTVPHVRHSL